MRPTEPFYVAPGSSDAPRGRILLLSVEFPPSGSAGALRWQRLAAHARERGWLLDVVTVQPEYVKRPESGRLEELPPGTRVYGAPSPPLLIDRIERWLYPKMKRLVQWLRRSSTAKGDESGSSSDTDKRPERPHSYSREEVRNLPMTPRSLVRAYYLVLLVLRNMKWGRGALKIAEGIHDPEVHRVVVSCGPPHEAHAVASKFSRRTGMPHVMDLRDPWSLVERIPEVVASPIGHRIAAIRERRAVENAVLVVMNTSRAAEAMIRLYPHLAGRCIAVMNGYDEEDLPPQRDDGCFRLAYAGSIYLDRDPRGLFKGAANVVEELNLDPSQLTIEFMGTVESFDGLTLEAMAGQEGLEGHVHLHPRGPRAAALEFLAGATMLVSLPQDSHMAIPSKVFEYMGYDAWLLALAKEESATGSLLADSGADVVPPKDVDAITDVIRKRYLQYRESGRPQRPALVPEASRPAQAEKLFRALDRVLDGEAPDGP